MKKYFVACLSFIFMLALVACGMPDAPKKTQMQEDTEEYISKAVDSTMQISYFSVDEVTQPDNKTCTARCIVNYENQSKKCVDLFELKYLYKNKNWEIEGIIIDAEYSGHAEEILAVAEESGTTASDANETLGEGDEPTANIADDIDVEVEEEAKEFEFTDQSYISFDGIFLEMLDYSLFGKSYDEVNEIFGGELPATESVAWYYSELNEIYDWTEYKEAGGLLELHGINFMFQNDRLVWINYDRALSGCDEIANMAERKFGSSKLRYKWNINDEVAFDIGKYTNDTEGTMYHQRYGIWQW